MTAASLYINKDTHMQITDLEIRKNVRYNSIMNILDGAFFGAALGFSSFVTVLPLFVSTLTDSAWLIGLINAIHMVGWQLPQLLTAHRVAALRRYKPMVLLMTIHERLPFLFLALVAWLMPVLGTQVTLLLTYILLIWQGLGGGLTATAWQSMIGKIIPPRRRGAFYGTQSAAANLLSSGAAILAGILLERLPSPLDFSLCFFLAGIAMAISFGFLSRTREPDREPTGASQDRREFWRGLGAILRRDINFRWFLVARLVAQLALMAIAFYTVYAVRDYGMSDEQAGIMTAILMITQTIANPLMGLMGDRWGHRLVMQIGAAAATISALLAWLAPGLGWFYLVFALAGIGNIAFWTTALAMTLEFGTEDERPAYIGLANTLVAPGTLIAPLIGGWLADFAGYGATFATAAFGGLITLLVLQFLVRNPGSIRQDTADQPSTTLAPEQV